MVWRNIMGLLTKSLSLSLTGTHLHTNTHSTISSLSAWEMGSDTRSNFLKYWSARVKHCLTRGAIYGKGLAPLVHWYSRGRSFSFSDASWSSWNIALRARQSIRQQNLGRARLKCWLQIRTVVGKWLMIISQVCKNKSTNKRLRNACQATAYSFEQ